MIADPKPDFKQIYVRSPEDDAAIRFCLWKARIHPANKDSLGILIIGEPGSGKSSLLKALQRQALVEFGEGARRPAPMFTVPVPCTPKSLSNAMRGAMGDPYAAASAPQNLDEMKSLYRLLGTKVFIGDEGHNMGADDGDLSTSRKRFLKRFMNDLSRVLVFAGTRDFEVMVRSDEELSRRFKKTFRMRIYNPDDDKDMEDWKRYMGVLDRGSGLKESGLATPDVAYRICKAAGGKRGDGFDLVDQARDLAVEEGAERIEVEHLSEAFVDFLAERPELHKSGNPFDSGRLVR